VAEIVQGLLVVDPITGSDGTRPPVDESGWLANGVRSPAGSAPAMDVERQRQQYLWQQQSTQDKPWQSHPDAWQAPVQNAKHRHSVFIDIELWNDEAGGRRWSCPYLAAVWQLMRLGVLRYHGAPVVEPVPYESAALDSWQAFPALVQLTPNRPAPFTAYCTFSALSSQFLGIEHAVRTILGQVAVAPEVEKQLQERITDEGLRLPTDQTIGRVDYAFVGPAW
jgi:hypothetical protein